MHTTAGGDKRGEKSEEEKEEEEREDGDDLESGGTRSATATYTA
jgi:hypothetical protein